MRTPRHAATATAAAAVTALALALAAGCGPSGAAGRPGPTPPGAPSTAPQTGAPDGPGGLVLTDVDVVEGDGSDRVVITFDGTGTPGWQARYVDRPVVDGSGETPDLGGGATLDVYASDTTWPAPGYYDGPARLPTSTGGAVAASYVAGTFEGVTQVLVGLEGGPASYRVSTRTDPTRLVVEVDDPA
ncbi:AMIN-like domain-containing (lipo)protein [Nocardioides litoris]|uniref:AMIN-like domain-containing (lipo)protein n=1 Tax=Nocardioides litoris TaxID=1926648 RepID=UPI00112476D1|nr:hypothetical protein [Nocardioides litoris]